jgi:hypothetical protein
MGCQKWSDLAKSGPPSGPLLVAEKGPPGLKWAAKSSPTLPKVITVTTNRYTLISSALILIAKFQSLIIQNDSMMQTSLTVTTVPL